MTVLWFINRLSTKYTAGRHRIRHYKTVTEEVHMIVIVLDEDLANSSVGNDPRSINSVAQSSPSSPRFDPSEDSSVKCTAAATQRQHLGGRIPLCKVNSLTCKLSCKTHMYKCSSDLILHNDTSLRLLESWYVRGLQKKGFVVLIANKRVCCIVGIHSHLHRI